MSLTATNIYDKIDRCCGTDSTSYPTADKAIDVTLAQDEAFLFALKTAGWNVDDFNHTKDPFITADLVATQRDYHFTYDEQSNLILGIYKVMAKDAASGTFHELTPVDIQRNPPKTMIDGANSTGVPTVYDKTSNGIFLDLIPSYSSTGGLKVFIDREMLAYTGLDAGSGKVSGLDGLVHDYLYLKPSYEYTRDKGKQNVNRLKTDMLDARKKIDERYGRRERDVVRRLSVMQQRNK